MKIAPCADENAVKRLVIQHLLGVFIIDSILKA